MQFWLLKSEPNEYSWQKIENEQITSWDGIRNHQAQNYMKIMKLGDLAFFYHTGKEKAIVGIVEVVKGYYYMQSPVIPARDAGPVSSTGITPGKTANDPKFGLVDVKFSKSLDSQVTLQGIKQNPLLKDMSILKQPRLSVSPVSEAEWNEIIRMSKC
jgi:predicted RNA-binding protein with PUA-like domain